MDKNTSLPLAGVKVLELATVVAMPVAGRIMASYGAEVIKIETPPDGDLLRPMGTGHSLHVDKEHDPIFDFVNSGKKITAIDLKTKEGMEVFEKLLDWADVLTSNIRMRSLAKMGLDYESVKKRHPRLIYAHFSGFGLNGPDCELPGFDTTAFWMRIGGAKGWVTPGSYPLRPSFAFGDIASASMMLNGIMIALFNQQRTGQGTMVGTSLFGCGIWANAISVMNSQPSFGKKYPLDRYQAWDPFSECYPCADGKWIAVIEVNYLRDKYFFAQLYDLPELLTDPDFATLKSMADSGRIPEMVKKVEARMKEKTSEEWKDVLSRNNIPNQILMDFCDIANDEQAWANDYLARVNYPGHENTAMPMPPLTFSAYERTPFEGSGTVGRDTASVLEEVGFAAEEIAALREKKVIQ